MESRPCLHVDDFLLERWQGSLQTDYHSTPDCVAFICPTASLSAKGRMIENVYITAVVFSYTAEENY